MKGLDLAQLTSELEYQNENRQDYASNTEGMALQPPDGTIPWQLSFSRFKNGDSGMKQTQTLPVTDHVLTQIASYTHFSYPEMLRIAKSGTRREIEALSTFLSVRLQENPHARKVRTVARFWEDPQVVAFVDARFSCASAYSILTEILNLGLKIKGLTFTDANLNDNYMTVRMLAEPRDGIASGLMFEYSEVGLISCVRPLLVNVWGHTIVPTNHHIFDWANVDVATAKQCLMGARSAVKKYGELAQRHIPDNIDLHALLEEQGLSRDEIRKVMGHFLKTESRTHQAFVDSIAKYAALASKLSYERTVELECIAGTLIDFTNDSFKLFAQQPSATTKETPSNGTKETPKQGKKSS